MNENSIKQLATKLSSLTIIEAIELTKVLRASWGIELEFKPVAPVPTCVPANITLNSDKLYNVILVNGGQGSTKIATIKLLRELRNLGLAEAKGISETPNITIMEGLDMVVATDVVGRFKSIGASAKFVES